MRSGHKPALICTDYIVYIVFYYSYDIKNLRYVRTLWIRINCRIENFWAWSSFQSSKWLFVKTLLGCWEKGGVKYYCNTWYGNCFIRFSSAIIRAPNIPISRVRRHDGFEWFWHLPNIDSEGVLICNTRGSTTTRDVLIASHHVLPKE